MSQTYYTSYAEFMQRYYAHFPQQHRRAGTGPVQMILADQPPHESTDAAIPDQILVLPRRPTPVEWHLGDGWRSEPGRPQRCFLYPAYTEIQYRLTQPHQLLIVSWPATEAQALIGEHSLDVFAPLAERPFVDPLIWQLGERLWHEAGRDNPGGQLFAEHALQTLLGLLLNCAQHRPSNPSLPHAGLPKHILNRVTDQLRAELDQEFSLSALAKLAGLSPHYFARQFKTATGQAPYQYLMQLRIDEAKRLLATTERPIIDVGLAVGYGNQARFTSAFKQLTGTTPARYRREARR